MAAANRRGVGSAPRWLLFGGALVLVVSACSATSDEGVPSSTLAGSGVLDQGFTSPPPPALDTVTIAEGAQLYAQYCATCHKADLSGDPNWKRANSEGVFPPPPHDDSGHTWHHPDALLAEIVLDGFDGVPSGMPKFRGTLTDDQVLSILEFFRSEWGDEERAFQWQVTWQDQQ